MECEEEIAKRRLSVISSAYHAVSNKRSMVIDIAPWPEGLGFNSASAWWEYVRGQTDEIKVEALLTAALLSEQVCHLLLIHDQTLLDAFDFSERIIVLLSTIQADTLGEFTTILLIHTTLKTETTSAHGTTNCNGSNNFQQTG